ncbi:hypothetical protein [Acidovorax sp. FG27]|uniref:hypothetical protein n=1 Tax=Acidovorax sp. FG27 TaxID=3133652 RepID=UPI003342BC80
MSNWFESSPARSVVIHTLVVGAAVWAAFAFIFDENKVAVVRAQAESEKATASQYKAKTEVLEVEIARLRDENKKYQDWLTAAPTTIPFFESRLKAVSDENATLRQELAAIKAGSTSTPALAAGGQRQTYTAGRTLSLGEAFVDPKTNATIGIGTITSNFTADGSVTLPGQKAQELGVIKPGDNWLYTHDGKRYQLVVLKVDWFSNKAEVLVKELGDAK